MKSPLRRSPSPGPLFPRFLPTPWPNALIRRPQRRTVASLGRKDGDLVEFVAPATPRNFPAFPRAAPVAVDRRSAAPRWEPPPGQRSPNAAALEGGGEAFRTALVTIGRFSPG